jgi:hypothetical protein
MDRIRAGCRMATEPYVAGASPTSLLARAVCEADLIVHPRLIAAAAGSGSVTLQALRDDGDHC